MYQVRTGMGVAGISHPVGWGVYIGNFVFWVGIAHSGTLISAILHLVRARWRDAISRSAEAMTVFAVMTAGLFPLDPPGAALGLLLHPALSRRERQLWPNFLSPLVWDVCAVSTYFTVSVIFFYVGLIPDLAAARDRLRGRPGAGPLAHAPLPLPVPGLVRRGQPVAALRAGLPLLRRAGHAAGGLGALGGVLGLRHGPAARLAHAPSSRRTSSPGAIHSGLAMVLTLLIPMRRFLHLERLIRGEHFDAVAR